MTKNNFERLAEEALRMREKGEGLRLLAPPPGPERDDRHVRRFAGARAEDGWSARRPGRSVQFAPAVSMEFKSWFKSKAAENGQSMASLLCDMRAAYLIVRGSGRCIRLGAGRRPGAVQHLAVRNQSQSSPKAGCTGID
jgi:hypothetical protein